MPFKTKSRISSEAEDAWRRPRDTMARHPGWRLSVHADRRLRRSARRVGHVPLELRERAQGQREADPGDRCEGSRYDGSASAGCLSLWGLVRYDVCIVDG